MAKHEKGTLGYYQEKAKQCRLDVIQKKRDDKK